MIQVHTLTLTHTPCQLSSYVMRNQTEQRIARDDLIVSSFKRKSWKSLRLWTLVAHREEHHLVKRKTRVQVTPRYCFFARVSVKKIHFSVDIGIWWTELDLVILLESQKKKFSWGERRDEWASSATDQPLGSLQYDQSCLSGNVRQHRQLLLVRIFETRVLAKLDLKKIMTGQIELNSSRLSQI